MLKAWTAFAMIACLPLPAGAGDHLVTAAQMQGALSSAGEDRARNLASVDRLLASPRAGAAAARLGADIGRVRTALPSLTDQELRDLSVRAAALETDPAAGRLSHEVEELLIIFLIVAIVILVLKNV